MNTNFEPVMEALFATLVGAATIGFTAQAQAGNATLLAPSTIAGLFPGLPVFGVGTAQGTTIAAVAADGSSITLSDAMTTDTVNGDTGFITGFNQTGRRVKHWNDKTLQQPALFLRRVGVTDEDQEPFTVTTLHCEAWIYCDAGQDPDIAPDSVLTCLEQMIRTALQPGPTDGDGRFTLGGLVYWCRIQGHSPVSPGDQGPQAKTVIPILITLP